ncbi:MAG: hypothetical protein HQL53_09630 [Magnetococcales bacterium]|nr:hypothetical protein [Magnetococcales bacterium]
MKGGKRMPLYNDSHPDVLRIRRQITELEQQKTGKLEWLEEMRSDPAKWEDDVDPIYRKIRMDISSLEVELVDIQERVQQLENQLSELRQLEGEIPAVEVDLIQKEHVFLKTKERLMTLLKKRSEVIHTGDVSDYMSKGVHLQIVAHPSVPSRPVGPNRPLFLTVVLIGALLAGLALALFLSVIRPVFDGPGALKKELGLPVLGMVSMVDDGPGGALFASKALFFVIFVGLIGAYGGMMALARYM